MRKSFWIIPIALFVAIGAPRVSADTLTDYTIAFTRFDPSDLLPTSGSFQYDSTTNQFTSFQVVWDGFTFDLTSPLPPRGTNEGPPVVSANEYQETNFLRV
jgi:nucleoside-specific outer membrane channel protein Tsx